MRNEQTALDELERCDGLALHDPRGGLEAFHLRGLVAGPVDDGSRRQDRRERLEHQRLAPLHADRPELDGEHVPVAVDDEAGHAVALRVDEAQAGRFFAR